MPEAVATITGPTDGPVSLAEAKTWLRVVGCDDDADIEALLAEAREAAEAECRRAFMPQTLSMFLDDFPRPGCAGSAGGGYQAAATIRLHRPPLRSVSWVKFYDASGVLQTIDAANYFVAAAGEPGRVVPKAGYVWPAVQAGRPEAVEIRYAAGYASAAAVPRAAVGAIKEILCDRYEHRGENRPIPATARRLLDSLMTGELR